MIICYIYFRIYYQFIFPGFSNSICISKCLILLSVSIMTNLYLYIYIITSMYIIVSIQLTGVSWVNLRALPKI